MTQQAYSCLKLLLLYLITLDAQLRVMNVCSELLVASVELLS